MNSILQCLSNTKELRDYCLQNQYLRDLNNNSRMRAALMSGNCPAPAPAGCGGFPAAIPAAIPAAHSWDTPHPARSPTSCGNPTQSSVLLVGLPSQWRISP